MKVKFYAILLAIVAFILIFNAKCFAHDHIIEGQERPELPEVPEYVTEYEYYCVYVSNNNWAQIIYSNEHEPVWCSVLGGCFFDGPCEVLTYFYSSNSWGNSPTVYTDSGSDILNVSDSSYRIVSNFDIKIRNSDEVVFQGASQPTETNQVVLAEIVEQQETNRVMEEILGILPMIIVVLVGLIAIRKAIAWIRQIVSQQ